jgi:hypothetical protein
MILAGLLLAPASFNSSQGDGVEGPKILGSPSSQFIWRREREKIASINSAKNSVVVEGALLKTGLSVSV